MTGLAGCVLCFLYKTYVAGYFAAPEDARMAFEENPGLANTLDSGDNGVACGEDPILFAQNGSTEETNESTNGVENEVEGEGSEKKEDSGQSIGQTQQTPATGGVALLPLAGSVLTAGFGGFVLVRRK